MYLLCMCVCERVDILNIYLAFRNLFDQKLNLTSRTLEIDIIALEVH